MEEDLWIAIVEDRDLEWIRLLLKAGVDPNLATESASGGISPLSYAVSHRKVSLAKLLLQNGAPVDDRDGPAGWTHLHTATSYGHNVRMLQILLKACTNVKLQDEGGKTPLHIACKLNKREIAKMLIKAGADVNAKGSHFQNTPLHHCSHKVMKIMLREGANRNEKNINGDTPVHFESSISRSLERVKIPVKAGAHVNLRNNVGQTALQLAINGGHTEVVKFLLGSGADLAARDNNNYTPLHVASEYGRVDIIPMLLQGAGSAIGKMDMIKTALLVGAVVEARDTNGRTPLHVEVLNFQLGSFERLLQSGADINSTDSQGHTPHDLLVVAITAISVPWINWIYQIVEALETLRRVRRRLAVFLPQSP